MKQLLGLFSSNKIISLIKFLLIYCHSDNVFCIIKYCVTCFPFISGNINNWFKFTIINFIHVFNFYCIFLYFDSSIV
ncbi:MAG TPA: hypothetical protein DCY05_07565 [Spirochaetaceae bacterium]|nr:hypothetical protein [Spirochaetaceae bacterium]